MEASNPYLQVIQSYAATTGALASMLIQQTMTVASTSNTVEALQVKLIANAKTGAWANTIFAQMDFGASGLAHGSASAVCAEISLPGASVVRGTYYAWQTEIECPASCAMNGNPIAVMSVSVWGDNKTQFDDVGLLFDISGVTSGSGKFWYDNTSNAVDEFLKVRTPSGIRYIGLSDSDSVWS
ncbi:hypothetical protein LCGC14_0821460 [marine sediment metagenome]|uniref:Uncharacterized protein n=1 Tax=marine sediment metagenome TaxID=412755 RepID=A0A0F9S3G3_9ZZZZ